MNKEPVRIQRSRKHKQVSPNGLPIVYVGRPTKWGNPYVPMLWGDTVETCIERYKTNMSTMLKQDALKELKGKNLSCWCKADEPCHADILLKLANQKP